MSKKFIPLKVKALEKNTEHCTVITLSISEEKHPTFQFEAGQYLTFKTDLNGDSIRRTYSLCTAPEEGVWQVAVKKVPNGKFSTYVNETLQVGDVLEVMPPLGRFKRKLTPEANHHYVAFAAGSGITPVISIIRTHLQNEPECSFQLFYVNQSVNSIIFREELEALKNQYLERFEIFHFLTQQQRGNPLFDGRMDEQKLDQIFKHLIPRGHFDECFICGPKEMIFLIRDYVINTGYDAKRVHFELFNSGDKSIPVIPVPEKDEDSVKAKIIEGGKTITFNMPFDSLSILDAALAQSADLPFACKGGVCCTCKARVIEGEVEMDVCYGLDPEEIESGYVLTCQAKPLTKSIVIDYDQN